MVKIVSLFLIAMVVLAIFGRLRLPRHNPFASVKCRHCGKPRIGRAPCDCKDRKGT